MDPAHRQEAKAVELTGRVHANVACRAETWLGITMNEVLEGILERIVYNNEENAWSVVRLQVEHQPGLVTVVGNLLGVQPGESLRLLGRWVQDKKYGKQFQASSYYTKQPSTLVGIERYLGSGLVRGIGKTMASRIVGHFGMDSLEVIEAHPERLKEVEGIGPVRSKRIQEAWIEQREIKEVMIFLQAHGISTTYAVRIYKKYGNVAIAVVKDNPYQLAMDIFGIGFKTADKIASNLGIASDSAQRIEAGVLFVMGELADQGNVYFPDNELVVRVAEVLQLTAGLIEKSIGALIAKEHLVQETISEQNLLFLTSLHVCESMAAARITRILKAPKRDLTIDVEKAIAWFEDQTQVELGTKQRDAVRKAVSSKILVITGGPGTGKTTVLNAVIRILEKKGRRILLCAPTGRAAKRMTETSGRQASTIHRLLEFNPKTQRFERDSEHPLDADLLVVDEASMLDVVLFYSLVKAVPYPCQIIFVGDVDQLPSVGPGNVLKDLIHSGAVQVVVLDEIFRQAQRSLIVLNAHRVNHGQLPLSSLAVDGEVTSQENKDFHFIERADPEKMLATLEELVAVRIPKRYGFDPVDGIQVLTPMHKGVLGVSNLNARLQVLLNPEGESMTRGASVYRVGDKVMQIRNNYDLEVFNGDLGRVIGLNPEERELEVSIDGRSVRYGMAELDELVLAYACSIHKSQGSEYPAVVIPVHTQHYAMLQRNLLYTAITRGRSLVVLLGSRRAVAIAVGNDRVQSRYSRLAMRLSQT